MPEQSEEPKISREVMSRKQARALGLKTYFTGKPCKQGHIAERGTSNGSCRECNRIGCNSYNPTYYTRNSEKIREQVKASAKSNPDAKKARDADYYQRNKTTIKARSSAWVDKNRGQHYDKVARRERRLDADYRELNKKERALVDAIYAEMRRLNTEAGEIKYHVDHIVPISRGGKHHPDNLQILEAVENLKKATKTNSNRNTNSHTNNRGENV